MQISNLIKIADAINIKYLDKDLMPVLKDKISDLISMADEDYSKFSDLIDMYRSTGDSYNYETATIIREKILPIIKQTLEMTLSAIETTAPNDVFNILIAFYKDMRDKIHAIKEAHNGVKIPLGELYSLARFTALINAQLDSFETESRKTKTPVPTSDDLTYNGEITGNASPMAIRPNRSNL